MAVIHSEDLDHFAYTTWENLDRLAYVDLRPDLQDYVGAQILMGRHFDKKGNARPTTKTGKRLDWRVNLDAPDTAEFTGMYAEDSHTFGDFMDNASIDWRSVKNHWGYDRVELKQQDGPEKIVDLLKSRRSGCKLGYIEKVEPTVWGKPASSSDKLTPFGLKYYLVSNSSEGFNGGNPSGFSDCAGIDASSEPKWRNWTFQYSTVSKADLITYLRRAALKTKWTNPLSQGKRLTGTPRRGLYVRDETYLTIENLVEAQNDNLGPDVAKYSGQLLFRGNPFTYVPYLDNDSTYPVLGVDWGTIDIVYLKGCYMFEDPPEKMTGQQHTVYVAWLQSTFSMRCFDRRRNFYGYK